MRNSAQKGDAVAAAIDSESSYVAPRSGLEQQARADHVLTPQEREDLSWFFDGAEGSFGVCSNYGAMEDELNRRSMSDEAKRFEEKTRSLARAERQKRKKAATEFDMSAAYAAVGLEMRAIARAGDEEVPEWAKKYIQAKAAQSSAGAYGHVEHIEDFLTPAFNLGAAARASHVRRRLQIVGTNWTGVLYGAYGPKATRWRLESFGNANHPATILGSPSLVEIAIALLDCARDVGDQPARTLLWSCTAVPDRAEVLKTDAHAFLGRAAGAYRITRCPRPCKRCWPV